MVERVEVYRSVVTKLAIFTLAMVLLPIGTYYLTRDFLFGPQNLTYPAIAAVTVANLILVGFVYVAFREDQVEQDREREEKRRALGRADAGAKEVPGAGEGNRKGGKAE
ncbi:Vacuolar ATPase assembly integral membrane protein VMA21 [Rhodotorula toruloides]|nr:Vacuolar ATPase assembly integral membrane protein VMA21 [Rhodotorula toruloides]